MAILGFIGDIHGHFGVISEIMEQNPLVERWFQVGDLGGEYDCYPTFPYNFHFIQGNHENWDHIQSLKDIGSTLFLPNGSLHVYKRDKVSYTVAAMGGNFSQKFFFEKTSNLYQSRIRHFTKEDFDKLLNKASRVKKVDILITHEAPSPYFKFHNDIGIPEISRLALKINPHIHIFGHHHNFKIFYIKGLLSVGLDYGTKSYLLYDTEKQLIKREKYIK